MNWKPAAQLSMLMDDATANLWPEHELRAILRHQLQAPLLGDLQLTSDYPAATLCHACDHAAPPILTFADLLTHPHPPLMLLLAVKAFAKSRLHHPDSPLPVPVATLLYYASILIALACCGERITSLDDDALRSALAWTRSQAWIDPDTLSMLLQPATRIGLLPAPR